MQHRPTVGNLICSQNLCVQRNRSTCSLHKIITVENETYLHFIAYHFVVVYIEHVYENWCICFPKMWKNYEENPQNKSNIFENMSREESANDKWLISMLTQMNRRFSEFWTDLPFGLTHV